MKERIDGDELAMMNENNLRRLLNNLGFSEDTSLWSRQELLDYIIDEYALDHGEELYKEVLLNMKSCIINNDFEDYKPQIIGLPKWVI